MIKVIYTGSNKVIKRICDALNRKAELGESHDSAYYGDLGKQAYDHSQLTSGNPHHVTLADLGIDHLVDQVNAILFTLGLQSFWLTHNNETIYDHDDVPILFRGISSQDDENNLLWH